MRIRAALTLGLLALLFLGADESRAAAAPLDGVHFEQRLGEMLPLDARFSDELGKTKELGAFLGSKPALLVFSYYRCPNLCTLVLNGLTQTLNKLPGKLGRDYRVISISIDPKEGPKLARAKKRTYLARLGRTEEEDGWSFLTGENAEIQRAARAAGFGYRLDPLSGEYAHPSGILVVTPRGRISQYFFGIQFDPKAVDEALSRAAREKRGSWVEQVLLYCFHYDPASSRNGSTILLAIRVAGGLSALALMGLLIGLGRAHKRGLAP